MSSTIVAGGKSTGKSKVKASAKSSTTEDSDAVLVQGVDPPDARKPAFIANATAILGDVAELADPLPPAEPSGAEKAYQTALERVRQTRVSERRSVTKLALSLFDFKAAWRTRYVHKPSTNQLLAEELAIDVTQQRIGQLLKPVEYLGANSISLDIPFKVYEIATNVHQKQKKAQQTVPTLPELVKMIEANPTPDAIRKAVGPLPPTTGRKGNINRIKIEVRDCTDRDATLVVTDAFGKDVGEQSENVGLFANAIAAIREWCDKTAEKIIAKRNKELKDTCAYRFAITIDPEKPYDSKLYLAIPFKTLDEARAYGMTELAEYPDHHLVLFSESQVVDEHGRFDADHEVVKIIPGANVPAGGTK